MKKISHGQGGFTLIELMVVIVIIAILTAIITANFAAARSKARDGQRISDLSQIQLALAGYFNQCNDYPASIVFNGPIGIGQQQVINNSMLSVTDSNCPSGITMGTFISNIPTPPAGANQAYYYYETTAPVNNAISDYVLEATLENNSSVSTESLQSLPSDMSSNSYLFCDSGIHYCLGPK